MDELLELVDIVPLEGICNFLAQTDLVLTDNQYGIKKIGDSRFQVSTNCDHAIPVLIEGKRDDTRLTFQCRVRRNDATFTDSLSRSNHWNFVSVFARSYVLPKDNSVILEFNYDCENGVSIKSILVMSMAFINDVIVFGRLMLDD
jgi:hypothetical protein